MDQETLVDVGEPINQLTDLNTAQEAGVNFLVRVFDEGIPVTDAFWNYIEEDSQWMLFIASPWRDEKGLRSTASALRSALDKMSNHMRSGLRLSDIAIVSPTSDEVIHLRRRYGAVNFGRGQRMARISSAQNDPIIYFLNHAVPGTEGIMTNG